jgi:hypothetical protein
MAEFLFARALNKTKEFRLASNLDGAGNFDDLVFRYRLREADFWKTCFIQLKHKENVNKIEPSNATQYSGYFSLLKYFKSFCEIKKEAATDRSLKQFGPFGDFEFIIYTNRKMESKSPSQGSESPSQKGESGPLSILSSGTDYGMYITFDEIHDKDIFGFFEELSLYQKRTGDLDSMLKGRKPVIEEVILKIEGFRRSVRNEEILGMLNSLHSNLNKNKVTRLIKEVSKCDFTLYKEFLNKVKIFHSQSNEKSLKRLIEKELQQACKASHSVVNFIYTKFEEGFTNWWGKDGDVEWLSEKFRAMASGTETHNFSNKGNIRT